MKNLLVLALAEAAFFLLFWLFSPTSAYILTLAVSTVAAAVVVISLIADAIEASRVSRFYYYAMLVTIAIPLLIWGIISFL